ncbi:CENPK protein, partial [Nyctibius bracteatus]|nr:CENPK protein [Nyctibius bracteatus]
AEYLPEIIKDSICPVDAKEELLDECERIWKQMEECQSKLMLLGTETLLKSDAKVRQIFFSSTKYLVFCEDMLLISTNPDVLLALGKEELQKVKNDLEMVLSTVQSKNKQLEEDLKREQQWHEEQQQILDALNGIEEETKTQVEQLSRKRYFYSPLPKQVPLEQVAQGRVQAGFEYLQRSRLHNLPRQPVPVLCHPQSKEVFPHIQMELPMFQLVPILINKLISTPHEPYITISDSFWPPYVELLLRYGIALRHPEDPNRIRLEAFHM